MASTHCPAQAVVPGAWHVHFPPWHVSAAEQAVVQLPQWVRSVALSTQLAPQANRPTAHVDMHVAFEQVWPDSQAWAHAPQLAESVVKSVHAVPHSVIPAVQLAMGGAHWPLEQVQLVGQSEVTLHSMVTLVPQLIPSSVSARKSTAKPGRIQRGERVNEVALVILGPRRCPPRSCRFALETPKPGVDVRAGQQRSALRLALACASCRRRAEKGQDTCASSAHGVGLCCTR